MIRVHFQDKSALTTSSKLLRTLKYLILPFTVRTPSKNPKKKELNNTNTNKKSRFDYLVNVLLFSFMNWHFQLY